jgi:hypothetical protein
MRLTSTSNLTRGTMIARAPSAYLRWSPPRVFPESVNPRIPKRSHSTIKDRLFEATADGRRATDNIGVITAPTAFAGRLSELYRNHVAGLLPSVGRVLDAHASLMEYVRNGRRLFWLRNRNPAERGSMTVTEQGDRIIWTDNAPAWGIHTLLLTDAGIEPASLARWFASGMPIEFNAAHRSGLNYINRARYHVAHLFDVQAGRDNSEPESWSNREVELRFLRNVHPCNAAYIPLPKWREYGASNGIKAFFYREYFRRYQECWAEFEMSVAGYPLRDLDADPEYTYSESDWPLRSATRRLRLLSVVTARRTPQLRDLIQILADDGRGEWTLAEIHQLVATAANGGRLKTTQPPSRIFDYYRPLLVCDGILEKVE